MRFQDVWHSLGAPDAICKLLSGVRIPFIMKPPLIYPSQHAMHCFKTKKSPEMTAQIQSMLDTQVLEEVDPSPSYLSTFFLVPKSDGSLRPIFNLKALNVFLKVKSFKLFSHFRMPSFLQQKDWLVKLDLSHAYFHLPIAQSHRRFLRMSYNGKLMQMTCLPFGLSSAPRTFASVTNWMAEYLRNHGIRCVVYLDDFLLASQSNELLREQTAFTVQTLQNLGWTINFDKSVLVPTRHLEFLGVTWDTNLNMRSLSEPKCLTLRRALEHQMSKGSWSLKQAQSLLGRLNFATFVIPRGRLHCRTIQYHYRQLSRIHPYKQFIIPEPALLEMNWWIKAATRSMAIHEAPISLLLTTDASDIGWGAQLGEMMLTGQWSKAQNSWHANLKELYAVIAAISHSQNKLRKSHILLQTDNRTVVSYINKEGGTKSIKLLELTRQLLTVLDQEDICLTARYFPGRFNAEVDALSRGKACPEWHLMKSATQKIFQMWGTPTVDLFASRTAHVIPNYVSLDAQDLEALFQNAFCCQWSFDLAWIFPPPNLMPQVLFHLNNAQGRYIIIAPSWNKVFWMTDLKQRAIRRPYRIPNLQQVLIDTVTGTHPPNIQDIILEAWLIQAGQK